MPSDEKKPINIKYMRKSALCRSDYEIVQQVVAQTSNGKMIKAKTKVYTYTRVSTSLYGMQEKTIGKYCFYFLSML